MLLSYLRLTKWKKHKKSASSLFKQNLMAHFFVLKPSIPANYTEEAYV